MPLEQSPTKSKAALYNFVINFQLALKPQIIKSYATDNLGYMHQLVFEAQNFLTICCLGYLTDHVRARDYSKVMA